MRIRGLVVSQPSKLSAGCQKVQVGNDQENAKSEIPTLKAEMGKTKLTISYLY